MNETEIDTHLKRLRGRVDTARNSMSELKAQQSLLLKRVQEDYNLANIDEAIQYRDRLKNRQAELKKRIESGLQEIEEKYGDLLNG